MRLHSAVFLVVMLLLFYALLRRERFQFGFGFSLNPEQTAGATSAQVQTTVKPAYYTGREGYTSSASYPVRSDSRYFIL